MKRYLAIAALCLGATASLSASVWTYPQDGATVGNPTYFDCSAPSTATYMKLWVQGWSNSLWTVHNTKRMVFVYYLPPGTYQMNCQYSIGGTEYNNYANITVVNNLYDANNVDDDPRDDGNSAHWNEDPGCSGSCTTPTYDSQLDTTNSTDGQSRWFSATIKSGGGSYQDIYFHEQRCGGNTVIGRTAGHYMINLDAESGATPRAYEWGMSQWYNGTNYRMVFQPNYADSVWKVYDEAMGQWNATNVTLAQVPIPTTEFKRVFLVGHPYTDSGGHPRVMVDAIQVGECKTTPCTDQDSDPIHVQPITTVANEPNNSLGTIAGNCGGTPGLEGNSQSLQLDLDPTHTSGKIWTDRYNVHLLP